MRWLLRIFFTLLVLVAVVIVGLFFVPSDQIARIAATQFEQATGRSLTISGKISPSLWPQIGARVEQVSVSNAEWSQAGPMLVAEALSVGLDLPALIGGDIKIRDVEVIAPVIRLEQAADGRVNWDFDPKPGAADVSQTGGQAASQTTPTANTEPASGAGFGAITLDRGTVENGTLFFTDHATGATYTLDAVDLTVALPAADGPADIDLTARLNAVPVSAVGRVEALAKLIDGATVPLSLQASIGKSTFDFGGNAGILPPVAKGRFSGNLSDMAAIAALAGAATPELPDGLGRKKAAIEGDLTWTRDRSLHLRGGTITLDGNTLTGDFDLTTAGERPKLTAVLKGTDLAFLADAAPTPKASKPATGTSGGSTAAPATPAPSGWSSAPIDVSGLAAMDAAIQLEAGSLAIGDTKVGPVQMALTNDRARAVFDITRMAAYGGGVSGQFVINGRGGLSVGGDLKARGLSMQPLLRDAAGYQRLTGTGELSMKFLGVGNSMAAIMSGLKGEGNLTFSDGALIGLDLAGMLRNLDVNYVGEGQKTIFDNITGSYVIDGGVLRNDDLTLAGPLVSATGNGTVGIGARTLDYRVVPSALVKSDGSGGIKVPLLIRGTWDDPDFKIDLEALAKEKLDLDEAELKAKVKAEREKAKAKAKAEAAKALGVDPAEGESLEDAAKRKLEEEALKGLGKLFGGN